MKHKELSNFFAKLEVVGEKFFLYLKIPKKWAYAIMIVIIMKFLPEWWPSIESAIQLLVKH